MNSVGSCLAALLRFVLEQLGKRDLGPTHRLDALQALELNQGYAFIACGTRSELDHLHHLAHEECFIANSVKTEIICEPQGA